jgi:NADPH:quinone reductase-like Zn-dependent oxidoreductase
MNSFQSLIKSRLINSSFKNQFIKSTLPAITTRMASSAAQNEDLKINKLFDVSSYSAIVTGGGTGIGLMITQTLVANGAKVYITGRREEALQKVVEKYSTGSGKIVA